MSGLFHCAIQAGQLEGAMHGVVRHLEAGRSDLAMQVAVAALATARQRNQRIDTQLADKARPHNPPRIETGD